MTGPVGMHSRPSVQWLVTVVTVGGVLAAIAGVKGSAVAGVIVLGLVVLAGGLAYFSNFVSRRSVRVVGFAAAGAVLATAVYTTVRPITPDIVPYTMEVRTNPGEFVGAIAGQVPLGGFVFPGVTSPSQFASAPPVGEPRHQWAVDNGGYDYGQGMVQVIVTAQEAPVQILGITPQIVALADIPEGIKVSCGCGDQLTVRHLSVDLDKGTVEQVDEIGNSLPVAFNLAPGTSEILTFRIWSLNCTCRWNLAFDTRVGGEAEKIAVTDGGQPFTMAAMTNPGQTFDYLQGAWVSK